MDGHSLYRIAVETALSLPGSEIYPFTQDWEAVRVCDKWFMLSTVLSDQIITVKAEPRDAAALVQKYTAITPGYHMNKKHWITIYPNGDVVEKQVVELVTESYLNVVAKLPKKKRPVDPFRYGQTFYQDSN